LAFLGAHLPDADTQWPLVDTVWDGAAVSSIWAIAGRMLVIGMVQAPTSGVDPTGAEDDHVYEALGRAIRKD